MHWKYVEPAKSKKKIHIDSPITDAFNLFQFRSNRVIGFVREMSEVNQLFLNMPCKVQYVLVFSR